MKHLSEVAKESDKNVAVFRVVEDVVLHHFCVFSQVFVFRGDHFIDVEKKLFVGLKGIVKSVEREGEGEGGVELRVWRGEEEAHTKRCGRKG